MKINCLQNAVRGFKTVVLGFECKFVLTLPVSHTE